jgi:CRISPR-associated endonuclease/helicase Cas3
MFLAHSKNSAGEDEPLRLHLERVSARAEEYASAFSGGDEARLAGLLHDIGKYSDRFLARLRGEERGLDHWTMGAFIARKRYGLKGTAAAVAILGHHVGLEHAARSLSEELRRAPTDPSRRLTESDPRLLLERLQSDGLALPEQLAGSVYDAAAPDVAGMLDIRMLFSALVDADFIETEAHFNSMVPGCPAYRPSGPELQADRALEVLLAQIAKRAGETQASKNVRKLRSDLLDACLKQADSDAGAFTLSAPTGAGKTLAMLAFALAHASRNRLRRVVVVIPYLSIIEQTAREYRELFEPHFGPHYVLEHHSLAGLSRTVARADDEEVTLEAQTARLLSENWDAPLIITTSVQCLESLFANRPSACRKLHRLGRSVVLFDEVQTLPPTLAVPTLAALSRLMERFGSSIVFATATQPAFEHLDGSVRQHCSAGWAPKETVPPALKLFDRARRTRVRWRLSRAVSWEDLADELATDANRQVLCIVNLKRHARRLAELLIERGVDGVFHLSTNMCPTHREKVLFQVRLRLQSDGKEPCRLISTQCVEAGVDVDFPAVYRALAPLDSITQAAGRCNREGKSASPSMVTVFVPEDDRLYPRGWYKSATDATSTFLRKLQASGRELDDLDLIHSPDLLAQYYRTLYDLTAVGNMDTTAGRELRDAFLRRHFGDTASWYRVIDQDVINVLVPFDPDAFARLSATVAVGGRLTREWIRQAREHAVGVYRPRDDLSGISNCLLPVPAGAPRPGVDAGMSTDWFVLAGGDPTSLYDRELLGLNDLTGVWIA